MDAKAERCEQCRFWKRVNADHPEIDEHLDETHTRCQIGHCLRFPPTVFSGALTNGGGPAEVYINTISPVTYELDWCGEFRLKES